MIKFWKFTKFVYKDVLLTFRSVNWFARHKFFGKILIFIQILSTLTIRIFPPIKIWQPKTWSSESNSYSIDIITASAKFFWVEWDEKSQPSIPILSTCLHSQCIKLHHFKFHQHFHIPDKWHNSGSLPVQRISVEC